jgi:hypothetical protein
MKRYWIKSRERICTGTIKNVGEAYIAHGGLLSGGNIVQITGKKIRKGGQTLYPFESLDGSQPSPDINEVNVETRPDLLQRATIAHFEELDDGTYRMDPFPHLKIYNAHTVILNISTKQNYVPANRIKFLDHYETPNPYNPERDMNFAK